MVVDMKTKRGEFLVFPLDYTDEQCLKDHGVTMSQWDDIYGYMTHPERELFQFLFNHIDNKPDRIMKFELMKKEMLEMIQEMKCHGL